MLGGAVLLLGVVFLFAIAVNRGWVSPWLRCGIGVAASAIVLCGGFWARRRYGRSDASLVAAGVGFSGLYASLAAATLLYDLLSLPIALAGVVVIAAGAVLTAVRWKSQLVAANGLAAALVAGPLATGSLDADAVGLSVLVLAAGTAVCLIERWRRLLVANYLLVVPQVLAVGVIRVDDGVFAEHVLATWLCLCGFAAIVLAGGLVLRLGSKTADAKGQIVGLTLVLLSFPTVLGALAASTDATNGNGVTFGAVLLVPVVVYLAGAVSLIVRGRDPVLQSALLGAGTGLLAIAGASALGGSTLALVFAVEALIATAVAWRAREVRLLVAAGVYLALGLGHVLSIDVPPHRIVEWDDGLPGRAWLFFPLALAALALARAIARIWEGREPGALPHFSWSTDLDRGQAATALELLAGAGALFGAGLYALVLGHRWFDEDAPTAALQLEKAHVLASCLLVVVATLVYSLVRQARWRWFAVAAFVAVAVKIGGIDAAPERSWHWVVSTIALAVGALVAAGGCSLRRTPASGVWARVDIVGLLSVPVLAAIAASELPLYWDPAPPAWLLLTAGAAVLALLSGLLLGRGGRDPLTAAWVGAATLAGLAFADGLVDNHRQLLALALTAMSLFLLGAAQRLRDPRIAVGGLTFLGISLLLTLGDLATPRDLLTEVADPAYGLPALVACLVALVAYLVSRPADLRPADLSDTFDRWLAEVSPDATRTGSWLAGALTLYALGLGVLGLAQVLPGELETNFQRGQAVVSGVWAVAGLALLYGGLFRRSRSLRIGGLGILGLAVAKLFIFDLSQLSSLARAFSFMAVGAVLLVAGLVYTRLSSDLRQREQETPE